MTLTIEVEADVESYEGLYDEIQKALSRIKNLVAIGHLSKSKVLTNHLGLV